jgi:serine/threonine protein kinase
MSGLRPEERFSNLERIGRGSFGAVYRCTDIVSRDTVAVKIIDLEQAEDEIDDIQQVRPLTSSAAPLRQRREHTAQEGFASRSRLGAPVPSQRPESATSADGVLLPA